MRTPPSTPAEPARSAAQLEMIEDHDPSLDVSLARGLQRLGLTEFRAGQREAIKTLLRIGRLLLVAPTGGGKSLVYQLPAGLLGGTSLVVSPLISLMNDQVTALSRHGIAATYLAATLDGEEIRARMGAMARGEFELVYVAPERLAFPGFRSLLRDIDCPLVAIDEAHCISEWGHDFRPEYLQIGELIGSLAKARVLACTATATPVVRDEILARLGLPADTPQVVRGFARPTLALRCSEVRDSRERQRLVDVALHEALEQPGSDSGAVIVYAPTRKGSETEAARLAKAGWKTATYHAGLSSAQRETAQAAFSNGSVEVVVATNAFGMGIDRADVRGVIHLAPPGSLEAYYQEVGRAGRDGEDALGLLLVGSGDLARRRALIEGDATEHGSASELVQHKWGMFLELMRYAEGGSCRHDTILRYFGDEAETLAGCGKCDVCQRLAAAESDEFDAPDVTLIVRKALSAVARIHGRFGIGAASQLLRGGSDPRLTRTGLDRTPTFGSLREFDDDWLQRLLRRCVTAGWVELGGGDRPVVDLSDAGREVMLEKRGVRLELPPRRMRRRGPPAPSGSADPDASRRGARTTVARETAAAEIFDELAQTIFDALRARRLTLARAAGVPPYVIASDRSLREIALLQPATSEELLEVHGIGPAKGRRFGKGWLEIVAAARATREKS